MRVIDIHTHAFPDKVAQRAVPALEAEAHWKAALDGRVSSLLESMDTAGIAVSVIGTIATKPEQVEGIFRWCQSIRSDRIEPFCSVHPQTPDKVGWLGRFAEAGFRGIKLHPMYQDFGVYDAEMMEVYSTSAELGLVVLLHCGLDVAFPPDDRRAECSRTRRVIDAVPDLKLIATHMGGWRMWDESEDLLVGRACWLGTSFSLAELPAARSVAMMRAHGTDRVVFGTDSPWADQAEEIQRVRSLPLTPEEVERVLYANAADLLGL